jgi:hypothetical protein
MRTRTVIVKPNENDAWLAMAGHVIGERTHCLGDPVPVGGGGFALDTVRLKVAFQRKQLFVGQRGAVHLLHAHASIALEFHDGRRLRATGGLHQRKTLLRPGSFRPL